MNSIPEPHPLDFDWRFTPETVEEFVEVIGERESLLAVGTPSLARRFCQLGRNVTLVDRQPIHLVESHYQVEIDEYAPQISGFRTSVVDPPWYPEYAMTWIAWSANCVGLNGRVFASVWPQNTRPNGESEFAGVVDWLETWATVSLPDQIPSYEMPLFEALVSKSSVEQALSNSPRVGRLLKIEVNRLPIVPQLGIKHEEWLRFVFNDYQLALRMRTRDFSEPIISSLPGLEGWQWPYVSRRAEGRDSIDIWSSRNEVAAVRGSQKIAEALRQVALANNQNTFDAALSAVPALAEWKIPRPPYRRALEWTHPQ